MLTGNREAFAPLVERHQRAAFACAFAVTGDAAAAEDVLQDGFIRAFRRLETCRDPARFRPWLLAIVRHLALNHVRTVKRRRLDPLPDDSALGTVDPTEPAERQDEAVHLRRALLDLSAIQREVLILSDLQQLSHAEIAERTGLSVLMSRRHLSDARRRVREHLRSPHGE